MWGFYEPRSNEQRYGGPYEPLCGGGGSGCCGGVAIGVEPLMM